MPSSHCRANPSLENRIRANNGKHNILPTQPWVFYVFTVLFILLTNVSFAEEWYKIKGNLHGSNLTEWRKSSYSNRLATAGDMTASVLGAKKVRASGGMSFLRKKTEQVVSCVDEVATSKNSGHQKVTEIVAACMLLLGFAD